MTDCEKYIEMISARVDSELSAEQRAELGEHISSCGQCAGLLRAFEAISDAIDGTISPAPPELLRGVMSAASELDARAAESKKKKRLTIMLRYIPVAACIALILLVLPRLDVARKNAITAEAPQHSSYLAEGEDGMDSGAYGGSAGSTSGANGYFDAAPAPSDTPVTEGARIADGSESKASEPMSDDTSAAETPAQARPAVPEPSDAPALTPDTDDAPDEAIPEAGMGGEIEMREGYFAVIMISSELPELLSDSEKIAVDDAIYHIIVTRDTALKLIDLGYTAELHNSDAAEAVVIWNRHG